MRTPISRYYALRDARLRPGEGRAIAIEVSQVRGDQPIDRRLRDETQRHRDAASLPGLDRLAGPGLKFIHGLRIDHLGGPDPRAPRRAACVELVRSAARGQPGEGPPLTQDLPRAALRFEGTRKALLGRSRGRVVSQFELESGQPAPAIRRIVGALQVN